jgi:small subunit ribosomal protein S7
MSRKGPAKIRTVEKDAVYNNLLVSKLITAVMKDGKKNVAIKQVYLALDLLKKKFPKEDTATVLEQAIEIIKPKVEVRPRRIGGSVYQVPTPVKSHRQNSLAIRWLATAARAKANKQFHTFGEKIADEITLALKNEGSAFNKKQGIERMAEANKAFAHLRW